MAFDKVGNLPDGPRDKTSPRRFSALGGCLLAILAGALGFLCTWTALSLGARGELAWRLGQPTEVRVWLLRGEDIDGIGWSRGSVVDRRDSTVCVRTLVGFWTWRGTAPDPGSPACDCYERQGSTWVGAGGCP